LKNVEFQTGQKGFDLSSAEGSRCKARNYRYSSIRYSLIESTIQPITSNEIGARRARIERSKKENA